MTASTTPTPTPAPRVSAAIAALHQALDDPAPHEPAGGSWRWTLRQRLAALRDALSAEAGRTDDGWLAARSGAIAREQSTLLGRVGTLGHRAVGDTDVEGLHTDLRRLLADVAHHAQRVHDLAYDDVELELGGSE